MLAFSLVSTIDLLIPAPSVNGSSMNIVAYIRDTYDCVTELNMSSVLVQSDFTGINSLPSSTNSSLMQMLASGNQNRISQVITSL